MSYETKTKTQGLSKSAKIAIAVTALVLLAAIIFGMVWTSLDHSYRYDREDLSVYLKEGSTIDLEGLGKLPISLPTNVTRAKWLDKIKSNILAVDAQVLNSNLFKKTMTDVSDLAYPDIVYMYYEVYVDETEAGGEEKLGELLISNTVYGDAAKATEVRLGSGTLNAMLEDYMTRHPSYKTAVERCDKEEALAGYTLTVNILGTYTDDKDATQTFIQFSGLNLQATEITAQPSSEDLAFYRGVTTLEGEETKIKDLKLDKETSDAIMAAFAGMEKLGDEAVEIKRDIKLDASKPETTEVTFKLEVTSAFRAEVKKLTFDLSNTTENPEGKPFSYTKPGESKATDISDKKLALRLTVESAIHLDKPVVEYLTKDAKDWKAPTDLGTDEDNAYAAAYMEYVKAAMIKEAADAQKKDTKTYDASVKSALWEEICDQYANDAYIDLTAFPDDVKQEYIDSLYASYAAQYAETTAYQTQYKSVENYILTKIYEVEDAASLSAEKQAELVNSKLTGEVEEVIRERILLFYLADYYEVSLSRRARRDAEREIYDALYASAHATYTAYKTYYKLETEADIARAAREDALQQSEAYCTPSYLREYVAINGVRDSLVDGVNTYPEITWTLEDVEEDAED